MSAPSSQAGLDAALEFERETLALVAEEMRPIEQGWVVRSPSLPDVWMFNNIRIHTRITYQQAVELCRRHLPDAGFDQLFILDEQVGEGLAEAFRDEGWRVDVDVHSVLRGEADRRVSTEAVIEASEDEALDLMERWMREDPSPGVTEEGLAQRREGNRLSWRARNALRLGIRDEDGRLAGMTLLYSDGRVAQVEDVYVIPEARARGYGRTLVTRAVELALQRGYELTFIVADDTGWPKRLYWKLGFEPVGRTWLLHRER